MIRFHIVTTLASALAMSLCVACVEHASADMDQPCFDDAPQLGIPISSIDGNEWSYTFEIEEDTAWVDLCALGVYADMDISWNKTGDELPFGAASGLNPCVDAAQRPSTDPAVPPLLWAGVYTVTLRGITYTDQTEPTLFLRTLY